MSEFEKCDMDLRKTLYANIVLSGGTTMMASFGDKLIAEVGILYLSQRK